MPLHCPLGASWRYKIHSSKESAPARAPREEFWVFLEIFKCSVRRHHLNSYCVVTKSILLFSMLFWKDARGKTYLLKRM